MVADHGVGVRVEGLGFTACGTSSETTVVRLFQAFTGSQNVRTVRLQRLDIGMMEKKMETTISYRCIH